ncbi:unnamed protein product [Durusdinium trenchii]|uniref:protein xylosyltransferase n=1 Tax=Durusdinium trenchii TaxID=1381693 RepID=A0ABP0SNZ7_9DINO
MARFGRALQKAVNTGRESSEAELEQDLQHLRPRTSARCFQQTLDFYRERVRLAAEHRRPRKLGEDGCPAEAAAMPVQMSLQSARQAAVAFLILANDYLAQVRRLIARILHPTEGLVLCHLDAKVARVEDLEHFRRWARGFHQGAERVQIFSSFSVHRGGRSMLDVQLKALQLLLASPIAWDYYVNLSDTHYPAEAMSWVGSYLWLHRGVNYARITSTKFYDPTLQGGKEATYAGPRREDLFISCDRSLAFECEGQLMSLTPGVKYPPLWSGVKAASGPEWLVLTRDFVEYVLEGLNTGPAGRTTNLVRAIYEDLASLSIPEETFFQTLLLTSPFCHRLLRHEFLYLDLYNAPWRQSQHSDFPFQSPRPLNGSHLREIATEEPWFVRKLTSTPPGRALRSALEVGAHPDASPWLAGCAAARPGASEGSHCLAPAGLASASALAHAPAAPAPAAAARGPRRRGGDVGRDGATGGGHGEDEAHGGPAASGGHPLGLQLG